MVSKGQDTRHAVLREALAQASHVGLQGISIGSLAEAMDMSKSGLFAHFRSKEQLQVDVLDFAGEHFRRLVLLPALAADRGEPRLRLLFERWLGWGGYADYALPGGCIFITAAREYDDEPDSPVRDKLVRQQQDWLDAVETVVRSGIRHGHFRADTDATSVAHELYGVLLEYHFAARLMRDPAAEDRARHRFDGLIKRIAT